MATPSWDLTDQDCDAFDLNWTYTDDGDGTVSTVTKDSRSAYLLESNTGQPFVYNASLSAWSSGTFEFVFKADGVQNATTPWSVFLRDNSKYQWSVYYAWDVDQNSSTPYRSIVISSGVTSPNYFYHWFDETMSGESGWVTLRIVIEADQSINVWVNGHFIKKVPYSSGTADAYSANTIGVQMYNTGAQKDVWFDHIRASSTKEEPDKIDQLVNINGVSSAGLNQRLANPTCRLANNIVWTCASGTLDHSDPVRFNAAGRLNGRELTTMALPLVATTDANASKVRVRLASVVGSLQLLPQF